MYALTCTWCVAYCVVVFAVVGRWEAMSQANWNDILDVVRMDFCGVTVSHIQKGAAMKTVLQ